ncbi:hypothetical protein AC629_42690 [Bradyrhizobium sp. NAS80.1]|nr:hypothetical protein AC629_42690 [Bradyrhizobium sp. NAS80.1]
MNGYRRVEVFFKVLRRFLSRAGSQAWSRFSAELGPKEKVALSNQLYFCIEPSGFTLMSVGAGEIQSMKLSVDDTKRIFSSIKQACDGRDIVGISVGELSWTTDARLKSNPEKITIKFNGPLGITREIAKREDVANAIAQFTYRFGLR